MAKKEQAGGKKQGYPWWLETLAAIGAAAPIAVIITLFFSVGRRPGHLVPTQAPAVDAPEFLAAVAGTAGSPVREGGTIHLLNNRVAVFPPPLPAIPAAQQTIPLPGYHLGAGPGGGHGG